MVFSDSDNDGEIDDMVGLEENLDEKLLISNDSP